MLASRTRTAITRIGVQLPAAFARVWRYRNRYLFVLPTFLFLIALWYYPAFLGFYKSLFHWDGWRINRFIGLQNYSDILTDRYFHMALRNVGIVLAFSMTLPVLMPLVVAEMIYNVQNSSLRAVLRVCFLLPALVPGMVHILVWRFIYHPQFGVLNSFLGLAGLDHLRQTWLGNPGLALPAVLFMGFPFVPGIEVLIYLAGLENISSELIDASIVDGATRLRRVVSIDLPLILGQVKLFVILGAIGAIQGYYNIFVLTNGGPAFRTLVPGLYLYNEAFVNGRMGYASAVGVILFVIVLTLTIVTMRYMRSSVEDDYAKE